MKARPRSVERKVASFLSEKFSSLGLSPVERIPVLGRTGPDVSINELGLVIDVKSRLEVPKSYFGHGGCITHYADEHHLIGVKLCDFLLLFDISTPVEQSTARSLLVERYYAHMDEWTKEKYPSGITCLVLHRPKMPIGKSLLIISENDRRRLTEWKFQ